MSLRGGGLCEDVSLYKPSPEFTPKPCERRRLIIYPFQQCCCCCAGCCALETICCCLAAEEVADHV